MSNSIKDPSLDEQPPIERRSFQRVQRQLICQYKDLNSENPSAFHDSLISDVTEQGIRFRSLKDIPLNHQLLFKIEIPGYPNIEVMASLVWSRELTNVQQYDIGARFTVLSETDKTTLRSFLSHTPQTTSQPPPQDVVPKHQKGKS